MLGPTLEPTPGLDRLVALPPELLNSIVALLLGRAVAANDALGVRGPITRWHAKVPSPITIPAYMNRCVSFSEPRLGALAQVNLSAASPSTRPSLVMLSSSLCSTSTEYLVCPSPCPLLSTLRRSYRSWNVISASALSRSTRLDGQLPSSTLTLCTDYSCRRC